MSTIPQLRKDIHQMQAANADLRKQLADALSRPVEIKEVIKDVPKQVIKVVEKPVEVIKEVPVNVIKEVERKVYIGDESKDAEIKNLKEALKKERNKPPKVQKVVKTVEVEVEGPERVVYRDAPTKIVYRDNPAHIEMIKKLRGK